MSAKMSARAEAIFRRTYSRPLDHAPTTFETFEEVLDRVIMHQRWLWERAKGKRLSTRENQELAELRQLMLERKVMPAGRTLWLGGTDVSKKREATQFNCSFLKIETVHDVVDAYWLLMLGCGVGFEPIVGTLNGFTNPVEVEVVRSQRTTKGNPHNAEWIRDGVWHLMVGDSAEAWAKAAGKLLAQKAGVSKLILDFSQVRPAGERLRNYGWISSGDETISDAFPKIATILNERAGQLLTRMNILDIMNLLGTTLSSRRSAEIALVPFGDPEWDDFANAKYTNFWKEKPHRAQSNNSLVFYSKPTRRTLAELMGRVVENGGAEPGFINGSAALHKANWFKGVNPCAEILLGNRSFCNLVEVNVAAFGHDMDTCERACQIVGRANYRQTCVDLRDGVLQSSWHELNSFLRLCGVGLTGICAWTGYSPENLARLRRAAQQGANGMAMELNLPPPKAVTTVKPSGTISKIMDTTEGVHKPLGRFILNNVVYSAHDPQVSVFQNAGYKVVAHPDNPTAVLVTFPQKWDNVKFDRVGELEVNLEPAVNQLTRYKEVLTHYADHNVSNTISYSPDEVPAIVDWLDANWDDYIGVSFLFRTDPLKTPADLGFAYLPQEVVSEATYLQYVEGIRPLELVGGAEETLLEDGLECSSGVCPIR